MIIALFAGVLFAGNWPTMQGRKNVTTNWVYWYTGSSGTDSLSTKILFNNSIIYVDSADTWVRIDNTADSCSKPFNLTDGAFSAHAINIQTISGGFTSNVTGDNSIALEVSARDYLKYKDIFNDYVTSFSGWFSDVIGDGNETIKYSLEMPADSTGTTSKVYVKANFHLNGDQGRLCPSIPSGSLTTSTDSMYVDSLYYRGR